MYNTSETDGSEKTKKFLREGEIFKSRLIKPLLVRKQPILMTE